MEFRHSDHLQLSPVFGVACTNYFYFDTELEYFEFHLAAVVIFCNLHIISFVVRYCENSHGISTFK